jgi:hypothetical protein
LNLVAIAMDCIAIIMTVVSLTFTESIPSMAVVCLADMRNSRNLIVKSSGCRPSTMETRNGLEALALSGLIWMRST